MMNCLVLTCLLVVTPFVQANVPAIVFSNHELYLGDDVDKPDRLATELHSSSTGPLVVISLDKLGLADLNKYGEAFGDGGVLANLKKYTESFHSRHLLMEEDQRSVRKHLEDKTWSGGFHIITSASEFPKLSSDRSLVQVKVGDKKPEESMGDYLRRSDQLLGEISNHLLKQGAPLNVVFTAEAVHDALPVRTPDVDGSVVSGRHLLAAADTVNGTLVNCTDQLYMFYKQVIVTQKIGKLMVKHTLPHVSDGQTLIDPSSVCKNNTKKLVLVYKGLAVEPPIATLKLEFNFDLDSEKIWHVMGTVSVTCGGANCTAMTNEAFLNSSLSDISGSKDTSYHCFEGVTMETLNSSLKVTYTGFQIQPFDIKGAAFSSKVNDCVGFFTFSIFMFLFSLLVLVMILMYGVLMLASINTPDRFDDPKGKTIQVHIQEAQTN